MTTALRDAFLADIVRDPFDDAPRLVYADWLEDHGDPERADVIRKEVADPSIGYAVHGSYAHDSGRNVGHREDFELVCRRGFYDEVRCPLAAFRRLLEVPRGPLSCHPLTRITLTDRRPWEVGPSLWAWCRGVGAAYARETSPGVNSCLPERLWELLDDYHLLALGWKRYADAGRAHAALGWKRYADAGRAHAALSRACVKLVRIENRLPPIVWPS